MKITNVRLRELTGMSAASGWAVLGGAADPAGRCLPRVPRPDRPPATELAADRAPARPSSTIVLIFIEIETDEGVTGVGGPVSHDVATLLHIGFRKFLIGQDPLATERLWDIMYRDRRPRPQGHADVRDQRDRLRPLGPARQIRQPAGPPPARRPDPRDRSRPTPACSATRSSRTRSSSAPRTSPPRATPRRSGSRAGGRADGREGIRKNVELMENPARVGRAGERHHDRRLDVLERALHARHGPAAEAVRPALAGGAGAARQDRAVRRDPGRLGRPDQRRRARVHPLRDQGSCSTPARST